MTTSGLEKENMMERHRITRRTLDPLAAGMGTAAKEVAGPEQVISPAAAVGLRVREGEGRVSAS